jgi:hypothetical protein
MYFERFNPYYVEGGERALNKKELVHGVLRGCCNGPEQGGKERWTDESAWVQERIDVEVRPQEIEWERC